MLKEKSPLERDAERIQEVRDAVTKEVEQSQDVKDGKCTPEDEKKEPGYLLFDKISESVQRIIQSPEVAKGFVEIGKATNEDVSINLVRIIAFCSANAAYEAICFYDELLKMELQKQFDNIGRHINLDKADLAAYRSVLEVFRKRLDKLEGKQTVEEFTKENGVPSDPISSN